MNKLYIKKAVTLLLALPLMFSCVSDLTTDSDIVSTQYSRQFITSLGDDTRVNFEGGEYAWEGREQIGVYTSNGEVVNKPVNILLDKESGLASFTLSTAQPITGGNVMAYLPYSATNDTKGSGSVLVNIPMSQTQDVVGVFNLANMPMVSSCKVEGDASMPQTMYFRPLGAFLAVNIYAHNRLTVGEKVRYVTFESNTTAVSGMFSVDLASDKSQMRVEGTSKSVMVKLQEQFAVELEEDDDGNEICNIVYLVVAPGTHSGVLTVYTDKGIYQYDYEAKDLKRNGFRRVNIKLRKDKRQKSAPLKPNNNIVAHRGGGREMGAGSHPDNSLKVMRYTQSLGCMAAELDIYHTKDERVIVAHADGNLNINGMHPWEHTLEEIRLAGKINNGEPIPTLEELIEATVIPGSCTQVQLDVKKVDNMPEVSVKAGELACALINKYNAEAWFELCVTGHKTVMRDLHQTVKNAGIYVGWATDWTPAKIISEGRREWSDWVNVSCKKGMSVDWGGNGEGTNDLQDYLDEGMKPSVYCVDKEAFYSHAIYDEASIQKYLDNLDKFYCVLTNYPKWLLEQRVGKSRDYYAYGAPVGRGDNELVTEGLPMTQVLLSSSGAYSCTGYFHNTNAPSRILINTDNKSPKFPCYALGANGRLVQVQSAEEAPEVPAFDIDGMRTLTVNFNQMTYEFERVSTPNALPDDHVPYYPTAEYTANGRTKTWMTQSLDWDGGKNARTLKLGTRPAVGTATGGYGALSYLSTARIAAYDDVESGGSVQGSAEHAEAGGRLYTPSEIITGVPSAGVDLLHYLADWPVEYRNQAMITDAVGSTYVLYGLDAAALPANLHQPALTMQVQGICPYGWHVANAQDVYDLLCAAAAVKGESAPAMGAMLGTWSVADILRSGEGWNGEVKRHASADDFGFNLYPSGERTYAEGFSSLGESISMFVCMLGDRYASDGTTTGSRISGVNCSWYVKSADAKSKMLTVDSNHIVGTTAMPVRCVKNY